MNIPIDMTAFLWGLTGGFSHCIGMCGVFVVSYAGMPEPGASRFVHPERHIMFHGGRLFALALLGLIGGAVGSLTHAWAAAQGAISIAAGVILLGLALGFTGIVPWFKIPEPDILGAGGGRGRRLFLKALQSQSRLKPLLIGLFVGLLPCGLTYTALISALPLGMAHGALLMLLFGLGTIPGLLTLGVFGNALFGGLLMNPRFRNAMTFVAAALMAVLGIAFILRGLPNLPSHF